MKKFLFTFALVFCVCCCALFMDQTAFADSFSYTNNKIELEIEHQSPISINDIAYFDNQFFITDASSNQIFKHTDNTTTSIYQNENFTPSEICANKDFVTFITTTDYGVYILKNASTTAQKVDVYKKNEITELFPRIIRIGCSATGEIFTISENFIAKINGETLEYFCALNFEGADLAFTNGGFYINEDATSIYFSVENKVYTLDTATKTIALADFNIPSETANISELAIDNIGNLFAFANSSIVKCSAESNQTLSFNESFTGMTLDFVNGKIFVFDANNLYESTVNEPNFITTYNNQSAPIELQNIEPNTTGATILEVTTDTHLYSFRSLYTAVADYSEGKKLILLDDNDSKFYYVYDSNTQQNSGYLLGYILKETCTQSSAFSPEFTQAKVIVAQAKIYTLPTSVKINATTFAPSVAKVARGEILALTDSPALPIDSNGTEFLAVKFTQNEIEYVGYIDSRTVINLALDNAIDNITVSNASTRADVVVYSDISLENEIETITKGTSITVLESKNGVCKIEYLDNGTIKTGYIHQSFVNDGSLTLTQIIGICLMIVSLIIAVIIAICLCKNRKKNKNKPIE